MKHIVIVVLITLFSSSKIYSQTDYLKFRPYQPYTWMVGVGWSFVDNDGRTYKKLFDVAGGWSMHYYPSLVSVDRYIKYGLSGELTLSFNQYKGSKMVNATHSAGIMVAADLAIKYSIYEYLYKKARWFDPYIGVGMSATYISATAPNLYPTFNVPIGTNFWIDNNWGIRIQATAKFGMIPRFYRTNGNYLQYNASVLYRFHKSEKGNRSNDKPRYKWVRDKPGRYKGGKSK